MPQTETWTLGRLLEWTTTYLAQRGSDSARLDAEVLLAEARGCQRIELYTAFDEQPPEEVRAAFRELVRRRAEGTPVAYLVGRREFYSLSFRVTPDVLIPRPETEFLVVELLDWIKQRTDDTPPRIADVGAGSGILAVCAAKHVPTAQVVAIDVSPAALQVARSNAADHAVQDRIEFVEGDLFAALPAEQKFDFIISNPPYVTTEEMRRLPPEVRGHEPHVALHGGDDGVAVIRPLIEQSARRLAAGGRLLFEISPMLKYQVVELLHAQKELEPGPFVKDHAGHVRVAQARRK